MDNSNNYYAMSDQALIGMIGEFVRKTRIQQQRTQQQVADAAGINRSTLVMLERGQGGTLMPLIQVLRVLQQLHIFSAFEIQQQLSPLLLAKLEQGQKQRVRKQGNTKNDANNLNW